MTAKPKIKVIKKGAVQVSQQTSPEDKKTAKTAAREMVSNVTNWVSDFQAKRREETKQAIEKLFPKQPQPHPKGV